MQRSTSLATEPSIEPTAGLHSALPEEAAAAATRRFVEHGRFVLRVLMRMGVSEQDAPDVCQDVFLTAFRRHDQWSRDCRETTWLYGICLRIAANHRRKSQRRREAPLADAALTASASHPEQNVDARKLSAQLDDALARLPKKKREVFVLYEFAEREMDEIAEIVGAPLKTCFSRLYAARAALQSDLAQHRPKGMKP